MIKIKNLVIVTIVLSAFSCKTSVDNNNSVKSKNENLNTETIEFETIAEGELYGAGEEGIKQQNLVITSQQDWNSLMAQMNSVNKVNDQFSKTAFNFSEETIIAVFDKVKGSGGHSITLSVAVNTSNTLITINNNAPEGIATSVMTQPYYIISITKNGLPIKFL